MKAWKIGHARGFGRLRAFALAALRFRPATCTSAGDKPQKDFLCSSPVAGRFYGFRSCDNIGKGPRRAVLL